MKRGRSTTPAGVPRGRSGRTRRERRGLSFSVTEFIRKAAGKSRREWERTQNVLRARVVVNRAHVVMTRHDGRLYGVVINANLQDES